MYDKDAANANARLSTQLPYILAISRFAHYLKAMMRDKIGSFMSRKECEDFLNTWILQYVVGNDDVAAEVKAQETAPRRQDRSRGCAGQAGRLPRRGIPEAAFPVG